MEHPLIYINKCVGIQVGGNSGPGVYKQSLLGAIKPGIPQ